MKAPELRSLKCNCSVASVFVFTGVGSGIWRVVVFGGVAFMFSIGGYRFIYFQAYLAANVTNFERFD